MSAIDLTLTDDEYRLLDYIFSSFDRSDSWIEQHDWGLVAETLEARKLMFRYTSNSGGTMWSAATAVMRCAPIRYQHRQKKRKDDSMFEQFAIVELFGHNVIAGKVTEQVIGSQGFVRVDVPEVEGVPAFTKLYGPGAIYAITPTDEATMLAAIKGLRVKPIEPWKLNIPQITEKVSATEADDDFGSLTDDGDDGQDIYRSHREPIF